MAVFDGVFLGVAFYGKQVGPAMFGWTRANVYIKIDLPKIICLGVRVGKNAVALVGDFIHCLNTVRN